MSKANYLSLNQARNVAKTTRFPLFKQSPRYMSVVEMKVPTMGDSITEGTIVEWIANPGDYIMKDDVLVVVETDKVSVDVRASESGKIVEHKAEGIKLNNIDFFPINMSMIELKSLFSFVKFSKMMIIFDSYIILFAIYINSFFIQLMTLLKLVLL